MIRKGLERVKAVLRMPSRIEYLERRIDHLERNVLVEAQSPIDRHVTLQAAFRTDALYDLSYPHWRTTRINKLLQIYGADGFAGMKILELGAGLCELGAFLAELGAEVTCLEGRAEQVAFARLKHRNVPNLRIEQADLEEDFSRFGRFDLILNVGLLYHLKNVDGHMATCFSMADDVVLETVVCDSLDPHKIIFTSGRSDVIEESLHGHACRPSPFYVERLAQEHGFIVERHFSADLNASNGQFVYDWEHKSDGDLGGFHQQRFWRLRRDKEAVAA